MINVVRASEHRVDSLAQASVLHAGRPTVVTVGVGAARVTGQPAPELAVHAARANGTERARP